MAVLAVVFGFLLQVVPIVEGLGNDRSLKVKVFNFANFISLTLFTWDYIP